MPQLWKTSRINERPCVFPSPVGTKSSMLDSNDVTSAPRRLAAVHLPPLIMNNQTAVSTAQTTTNRNVFAVLGDRSPVEPTSPGSPHYDQLLIELRMAQERRNRHREEDASQAKDGAPAVTGDSMQIVHKPAADGSNRQSSEKINNPNRLATPSPSPSWPSPSTTNHAAATTKTGPKKVRFLEDGTGNLHTSVFGGSNESLGSLLDSQQDGADTDETVSIDALISSLANYEKRINGTGKNNTLQSSVKPTVNGKQLSSTGPHLNGNGHSNGHALFSDKVFPTSKTRFNDTSVVQSAPETTPGDKVQVFDPHQRVQSFLDTFHGHSHEPGKVTPQNIFHLEPDDPNSVDSGSVLSELDFEETSSTITTESNKTGDSLNSPVMNRQQQVEVKPPSKPNRVERSNSRDLFAEVSDLLERSLQEIRQMEEDTVKSPATEEKIKQIAQATPPLLNRIPAPSPASVREPLYELIGRKRIPPAQLRFRSVPTQPRIVPTGPTGPTEPAVPDKIDDVWVPRADWIPPATSSNTKVNSAANFVWSRRPAESRTTTNNALGHLARSKNTNGANRAVVEDQSIYGRLWEAASSGTGSQSVISATNQLKEGHRGAQVPAYQQQLDHQPNPQEQQNQTVIRSMARKARLEHWRMAGMPAPAESHATDLAKSAAAAAAAAENGAHQSSSNGSSLDSSFQESAVTSTTPAFLSSLPLFQIPDHQNKMAANAASSGQEKTAPKKLGFQLTWPPPPIPQSPSSSSASATPVTPTCPNFPNMINSEHLNNGHSKCSPNSPKCFGHDATFQWPVPALPSNSQKGSKIVKRSGSFKQDLWTDSCSIASSTSDLGNNLKGCGQFQRSESMKEKRRSAKPANLEAAQDWYWIEEFPRGSGIEPGTGNMSTWFHGAISRSEAEARLATQPTGAFLARLTERLWGYALSVKNANGHVSHFLIDAGEKWHAHTKYTLLGSPDPPQKSLRELIQLYGKQPLTPDGMEKLLFPCPQESAVRCASRLK